MAWALVCWLCLTGLAAHAGPLVNTDSPIGFFTNVANRLLQSQLGLSLNHIQVFPTNQYTPAVHRLLQVTANLYDATTNRPDTDYPYLPRSSARCSPTRPAARTSGSSSSAYEEVTNASLLLPSGWWT